MKYLYDNHLGGHYITDHEQSYDECYCKQCGDDDYLLGTFETVEELELLLKDNDYSKEYIKEFIKGVKNDE